MSTNFENHRRRALLVAGDDWRKIPSHSHLRRAAYRDIPIARNSRSQSLFHDLVAQGPLTQPPTESNYLVKKGTLEMSYLSVLSLGEPPSGALRDAVSAALLGLRRKTNSADSNFESDLYAGAALSLKCRIVAESIDPKSVPKVSADNLNDTKGAVLSLNSIHAVESGVNALWAARDEASDSTRRIYEKLNKTPYDGMVKAISDKQRSDAALTDARHELRIASRPFIVGILVGVVAFSLASEGISGWIERQVDAGWRLAAALLVALVVGVIAWVATAALDQWMLSRAYSRRIHGLRVASLMAGESFLIERCRLHTARATLSTGEIDVLYQVLFAKQGTEEIIRNNSLQNVWEKHCHKLMPADPQVTLDDDERSVAPQIP